MSAPTYWCHYRPDETQLLKEASPIALAYISVELKDGYELGLEVRTQEYEGEKEAFLRVEAREIYRRFGRYYGLNSDSEFKYQLNAIQVSVDRIRRQAKFGPIGNIIINPKGVGIGSYLMSAAIAWLHRKYPDVVIVPGSLGWGDAKDEDNRSRRNRFYEKHGFDLTWEVGREGVQGSFSKAAARDLKCGEQRAKELKVEDLIKNMAEKTEVCRTLEFRCENYEKQYRALKKVNVRLFRILLAVILVVGLAGLYWSG